MGTGTDMEIKYGEGLEFDTDGREGQNREVPTLSVEKEDVLKEIIREGFRAPVAPDEGISLIIGGESCPVFNISTQGIGVYLGDIGDLKNNTLLKDAQLNLGTKSFRVDGNIVHVSQDEAQYLIGVELVNPSEECKAALLDYIKKSRKLLFS